MPTGRGRSPRGALRRRRSAATATSSAWPRRARQYKSLAKRYLRTFPQNEFIEDDAVAGYAYVKIVAQAIQNVGTNPQAIAAYVHRTTFNIPGYALPLRWTAWGEIDRRAIAVRHPDRGAPPEAGLNTASSPFWPRVLFKSPPLPPYRPPS